MVILIDGIIFQRQDNGGISRIFREVLPLMCSIDKEIDIWLLTSGKSQQPLPQHARIRHLQLFPIDSILRPRWVWRRTHDILKRWLLFKAVSFDHDQIWLSTYYTTPPYGWRGKAVAFVYDMIHEKYPDSFNKRTDETFRRRKRQVITSAHQVICISETTRQDMQNLYNLDQDRVEVAHLAHSPMFDRITQETSLPFTQPFILYVGNRTHHKNFQFLLETYAIWPKRHHINMVVVGPAWLQSEKEIIRQYDLLKHLHLKTGVSDGFLKILYNSASAFVYPSLYEGFGIPLLEAMACGCPLVASDIPSSQEVAANNAYYFDPTSKESLCVALDQAIVDGREAVTVNRAYERAKQFNWHKTSEIVLKTLRKA